MAMLKPMSDRACCTLCEYYYQFMDGTGECRFNPPVVSAGQTVFPHAMETTWCGKFTPRPVVKSEECLLDPEAIRRVFGAKETE